MGKVTERIKLTSLFDKAKSAEVEAIIDTEATLLVLPQEIVEELGLTKVRDAKVRYGTNAVETKGVYGAVSVELKGRVGIFEAVSEARGSQPLVAQAVLESIDLVVDPRTTAVTPKPQSPETPMVEVM